MPDYKLTYFDVDGGRAEPVRIAFHIAGIPFEDKRLSYQEFGEIFPTMRFHAVPVLEIDGRPGDTVGCSKPLYWENGGAVPDG